MCKELQKLYLPLGSEQDCSSLAKVPVQSPGSGMIYPKASQTVLVSAQPALVIHRGSCTTTG